MLQADLQHKLTGMVRGLTLSPIDRTCQEQSMTDYELGDGHAHAAPSPGDQAGGIREDGASFDAAEAVLRVLIGALLVGSDELRHQLEQWEATRQPAPSPPTLQSMTEPPRYVPLSESMRHALVGLLFETEARMRWRLSTLAGRLARLSDMAEYVFTTRLEPVIRQTPFDPVLGRLDELLFVTMATVDRWSARGRTEERQGRTEAREALARIADELLDYMSRNPEVRALIERQGSSIAEEAVEQVRERTASADTRLERLAHSLLHRPMKDGATEKAPSEGASAAGSGGG
jgi:hypothetical protein